MIIDKPAQLTFNLTWSMCITANRGLLSSLFMALYFNRIYYTNSSNILSCGSVKIVCHNLHNSRKSHFVSLTVLYGVLDGHGHPPLPLNLYLNNHGIDQEQQTQYLLINRFLTLILNSIILCHHYHFYDNMSISLHPVEF